MALSISVFFVSLLLCLSQSVFGTIQRRLACPCAALRAINSQVFVLHSFCEFCVSFPFLLLKEGFHCVVDSYGRVLLIVKSARLAELSISLVHCCGVVVGSLVLRCETSKLSSSMLSSESIQTDIAVFTLVSYMVAELVAETSRCYRLNGVAVWPATCQWCASLGRRYSDSSRL